MLEGTQMLVDRAVTMRKFEGNLVVGDAAVIELYSGKIENCVVVKQDYFWRFVAKAAFGLVAHYLTAGIAPHPMR